MYPLIPCRRSPRRIPALPRGAPAPPLASLLRLDPRSHEQGLVVGDLLAQGDGELLGGVADELLAHLVETLAHKLAMLLLSEFDIAWVKLSVNKPGAIRGSRDVGVEIIRHKAQGKAG